MCKKVFIITTVYPDTYGFQGGIFIHNQSVALKSAGADVSVLFYDFRSIRKKREFGLSKYTIDGVDVFRFALPCGPIEPVLRFLDAANANKLYKYAVNKKGTPEVLHAHFWDAGSIAQKLSNRYHIPYVVTEHSSGILQNTISEKEQARAISAYENASAVLAVGNRLKEAIQSMAKCTVRVVPNIIPDYMFEGEKKLVKGSETFYYVSIGNMIHSKRFDLTIGAFSEVHKEYTETRLIIIGEGPLESELREQVHQLKIGDAVEFIGKIPNAELPKIYHACDCFVLPSDFETFGMVYAEAMACGLPVIATKCGGPEDFVDDRCGMIIEKNSTSELIDSMKQIIESAGTIKAEEVARRIKDSFSEKAVTMELLKIYSFGDN